MHINISIAEQTLTVLGGDGELLAQFPVFTAPNGVGCEKGSGCTPLGAHIIRAKIGDGARYTNGALQQIRAKPHPMLCKRRHIQKNGHRQPRHLVRGNVVFREALDEKRDFFV